MENLTLVMLTDRNDLDEQLFGTFGNCVGLLWQKPVRPNKSREDVKSLLKVSGGGVIFTTIQKLSQLKNVYNILSGRTNIVVVAEEEHRSQYGFSGRIGETDQGSKFDIKIQTICETPS